MQAKKLSISIKFEHGVSKVLGFDGYALIDSGFLHGKISGASLAREEAVLLTAFTLTGCPIAARTDHPKLNPWSFSQGEYIGRRELSAPSFAARSRIQAYHRPGSIEMELSVKVEGDLPKLSSIRHAFQEKIEERQAGRLAGKFAIPFADENHELILAFASTSYELPIEFSVPTVWRNILIEGVFTGNEFVQCEQIDLFGEHSDADADLIAKLAVSQN